MCSCCLWLNGCRVDVYVELFEGELMFCGLDNSCVIDRTRIT